MIVLPKSTDKKAIWRPVLSHLLIYLFINLFSWLFKFLTEKKHPKPENKNLEKKNGYEKMNNP